MSEIRKQFEVLPEITKTIKWYGLIFNDSKDRYVRGDKNGSYGVEGLNLAWYAFQEQQKKIDLFNKMILSLRNEFNLWADDTESFNTIEAQIENLEELLK